MNHPTNRRPLIRIDLTKESFTSLFNIEDPEFELALSSDTKALIKDHVDHYFNKLIDAHVEKKIKEIVEKIVSEDLSLHVNKIYSKAMDNELDSLRIKRDELIEKKFEKVFSQNLDTLFNPHRIEALIKSTIQAKMANVFLEDSNKESTKANKGEN